MNLEEIVRSREEIDTLWFQAMRQSIEDGEECIRYHFAALVAAAEREACAKVVESRKTGANELMDAVRDMEAAAIRKRGEVKP